MKPAYQRFYVTERIQEICRDTLGTLYNVDLAYVTQYIFRICKITDMISREDKRNKIALQSHLEKYRKEIIPNLNDPEFQQAIINAIIKARIFSRGAHPNPEDPNRVTETQVSTNDSKNDNQNQTKTNQDNSNDSKTENRDQETEPKNTNKETNIENTQHPKEPQSSNRAFKPINRPKSRNSRNSSNEIKN
ncbi:hypothetical protein TVAG_020270 [Trichomonas vaginalis G3]|uniref:Uncharacterized protein n=1 Tax=Trichomonas vaginalis (strain ATCC PRA-98 / G3) TaxID=412133 RepID=A2EQ16_TRIV3|nr:hypothetical protein TVAGG3_0338910 [Trichomonas vaginalis G3]EAY05281.1 hypothetical protein TVAG_020270 [Trichomonas vaginalis G3]KAI5530488.1 hypothetical protein TVAGG3_0338910 [Trichomonas vaginalis G3]|eukprot:XP_001317504.1 hypothetical protein [Trichomonas vaginalis G3]